MTFGNATRAGDTVKLEESVWQSWGGLVRTLGTKTVAQMLVTPPFADMLLRKDLFIIIIL